MASLAGRVSGGRRMGRRGALMRVSSIASQRRTSVRIWLRATRADWVARKKRSLLVTTVDAEWNEAAIAVRSMDVMASEIRISARLMPPARRAVFGRGVIGA